MFAVIAAALLLTPPGNVGVIESPAVPSPAVAQQFRITLNGSDYAPGDRVRVKFESTEQGYLIVFRVDGDGRVQVLFPLDPDLDAFVRAGKEYELRAPGAREAFFADERAGNGLVYAALSWEPLDLRAYADGNRWDYSRLRLSAWDADAESELTQVVKRMSSNARFTYDLAEYRVYSNQSYISGGAGVASPPWTYGARDPFYDPYWSCLGCGYGTRRSGVGLYVSIGGGWNSWDPWFWDPYYDRWYDNGYRYGSGYGYGGYGYGGYGYGGYGGGNYPGQYRPITVINLPRPQVPVNTVYGNRARPRGIPVALAPDLSRAMRPEARPETGRVANDGRARTRTEEPTREARPSTTRVPERVSPPTRSGGDAGRPVTSAEPPRGGSVGGSVGGGSGTSSGTSSRARRPDAIATPEVTRQAPVMDRGQVTPPAVRPQDVQRQEPRPVTESVTPKRRGEETQPIFREPFRPRPANSPPVERRVQPVKSQPVYREPSRAEPARTPQSRAEPARRVDPPSPPPRRADPPPPPRSDPPSGGGGSSGGGTAGGSSGGTSGGSSGGRARRPDS